jgi:hypothetical protein
MSNPARIAYAIREVPVHDHWCAGVTTFRITKYGKLVDSALSQGKALERLWALLERDMATPELLHIDIAGARTTSINEWTEVL